MRNIVVKLLCIIFIVTSEDFIVFPMSPCQAQSYFGEIWRTTNFQRNERRTDYRFFFVPWSLTGISKFDSYHRPPSVHLPKVDISQDFDLEPELVAYDPSYVDFPPPPLIPSSDGYKTQFVCEYDYNPLKDPGYLYKDNCFYYLYTPKKEEPQWKRGTI